VFFERAGKAGARKELARVAVIFGRGARHHLFQGDSKLVGIERAPFAHFFSRCDGPVPEFQFHVCFSQDLTGPPSARPIRSESMISLFCNNIIPSNIGTQLPADLDEFQDILTTFEITEQFSHFVCLPLAR